MQEKPAISLSVEYELAKAKSGNVMNIVFCRLFAAVAVGLVLVFVMVLAEYFFIYTFFKFL
jgi:hypothetical protein